MQAVIIGATGATGQALVQQLLDNPDYSQVTVFVRRAMSLQHPKLTVEVIDFDQLQTWQDKVRGDVLFSCLGTTLKATGSKAVQWKITNMMLPRLHIKTACRVVCWCHQAMRTAALVFSILK